MSRKKKEEKIQLTLRPLTLFGGERATREQRQEQIDGGSCENQAADEAENEVTRFGARASASLCWRKKSEQAAALKETRLVSSRRCAEGRLLGSM